MQSAFHNKEDRIFQWHYRDKTKEDICSKCSKKIQELPQLFKSWIYGQSLKHWPTDKKSKCLAGTEICC